ncbi:MAG TPA: hypothetical protein VFE47_22335 [Tepidisphaeraceae bacterium]|jgi:hypothetical protein|nr:hypothetical protein [Tepidisphaeraceae bacterium]
MTLTLQLPDDVATRLELEAKRRGVMVGECLAQIVQERLPDANALNALSEMFAQWDREDATDDPAEIAARQAEWEELKKNLNANRGSQRKLFPE